MSEQLQELIDTVKQTQKEWLNPTELEAEYGILRSTQSKMRMAKTLPYHKVGKYVRYHRPDINEMFMDAKVV
jgi:hypothetical protein